MNKGIKKNRDIKCMLRTKFPKNVLCETRNVDLWKLHHKRLHYRTISLTSYPANLTHMGICLTFVTSHCKCPSLRYGQSIWRMKAIITACRKWIAHLYPIVVYPSAVSFITTAVWWGSCCSVFCELCTNFLTVVSLVVHCVLFPP